LGLVGTIVQIAHQIKQFENFYYHVTTLRPSFYANPPIIQNSHNTKVTMHISNAPRYMNAHRSDLENQN